MSALDVYGYPFKTYGAMYIGDPNIVFAKFSSGLKPLQNPKSPNLTLSLVKKMF